MLPSFLRPNHIHCMNALRFMCPDEYSGCFYFSATVNGAAVNIHVQVLVWTEASAFLYLKRHTLLTPHYPVLLPAVSHPQDDLFL